MSQFEAGFWYGAQQEKRNSERTMFTLETAKDTVRQKIANYMTEHQIKLTAIYRVDAFFKDITDVGNKHFLTLHDLPIEAGFQPALDVDLPTAVAETPRIPHIIHQVFLSSPYEDGVPEGFVDNVKSYLEHNPEWTYYFWTNVTARHLLEDRVPHLLPVYDSLTKVVEKGDMFRYVLMYEFGGLYADLDTVNRRPLDSVTMKYPCLLISEPFEHAVLWYEEPYALINAMMFCRAKHPLFNQILDAMPTRTNITSTVKKFGPGFLTEQFRQYANITDKDLYRIDINKDSNSPYFYKGEIPESDDDGVYIPNTRYFMDSPSPALKGRVENDCNDTRAASTDLMRRMCTVVARRGYFREPGMYTYLTHLWSHTWSRRKNKTTYRYTRISNMTKHFKTYKLKAK